MRATDLDERAAQFTSCRPRLYGIAYRMLGSRADAEDVLQDAYLRWHQAQPTELRSAEAWLVTVVTRLCVDRLRSAKTERAGYFGPWLPEPFISSGPAAPEWAAELASDVSMAFLTLLERLGPEERAAFLLHEVFEFDYPEIATMLDRNQAACRQMVRRARERVCQDKPRFSVSRETHVQLLDKFAAAAKSGDRMQLAALFAHDATLTADGGGKASSVNRILHGADRIARLYHVIARGADDRYRYERAEINGEPGLVRYADGKIDTIISIVSDGVQIEAMYVVRNPDKLQGIFL